MLDVVSVLSSLVQPCPALSSLVQPASLFFPYGVVFVRLFSFLWIKSPLTSCNWVLASSIPSDTWQNEPTMKRTQRRNGLHHPPPASTLSSPLYERILQFRALSWLRQQVVFVRLFSFLWIKSPLTSCNWVLASSILSDTWQNEPTMKRTQRRNCLHHPPPASTLSSPLYERILQFRALSWLRQQVVFVRLFSFLWIKSPLTSCNWFSPHPCPPIPDRKGHNSM